MSEKLEELISLLYQDKLTQYGKRLLVENIEKLLKKYETYIEQLRKELEQKDKIIDLMAEDIDSFQIECNRYFKDKEEVKQYFKNQVKEV